MVNSFVDYSDERLHGRCCQCGNNLQNVQKSKDHIPSKLLFDKPFPKNLITIPICLNCNNSFSSDEEYFCAFLSAVISGHTVPEKQIIGSARKILTRSSGLRQMVTNALRQQYRLDGGMDLTWVPDVPRIENFIIKNARGHAYHELAELYLNDPIQINLSPLHTMSIADKDIFLHDSSVQTYPEVGSRWFQRIFCDTDFDENGFLIVQPNVYKFRIDIIEHISVKSIIYDYMATEVVWDSC